MKTLQVAVDIYDEVYHNKTFYDGSQLDALMAYCRQLGATNIEWIYDDMWAIYDTYPGNIDLLKTAIDAAHSHGLSVTIVYKPYEGSLVNLILPHTMPHADESVVWNDLRGLAPIIRPFAAQHPEMCMARKPGDEDPGGTIREIRLVKNDDRPVTIDSSAITIWTSKTNGKFQQYTGKFKLSDSLQWRPLYPLGQTCRVLTLDGLNIPAEATYVELRFADNALAEPFANEFDVLIELVNDSGDVIPSTTAGAAPPCEHYLKQLAQPFYRKLVRYSLNPEVQSFLDDEKALTENAGELRAYARNLVGSAARLYDLKEKKLVSVARGKVAHLPGIMNPVYPEVRNEWLRAIQRFIDSGADAVNLRSSYHMNPQEKWAYGFNQPVLDQCNGKADFSEVKRIIGEAYTQFLVQARDLLHQHQRQIGIHLLASFLKQRDEGDAYQPHELMDHQWETWVEEIADFAVFRGAMGIREESLNYVIDRFANCCRKRSIPFIYQSNRRIFARYPDFLAMPADRVAWLQREMDYALNHDGITGYQLYETANFTKLHQNGCFQGNSQLLAIVKEFGFVNHNQ